MDPAFGKVDQPEDIEEGAVKPMTYVIGVDNGELLMPALHRMVYQASY